MEFLSLSYALFFLSVLGIYWTVSTRRARLWILLIASIVFYASLQFQYIPLLIVSIFINYKLGRSLNICNSQIPDEEKDKEGKEEYSNSDLHIDWSPRRFIILWLGIFLNVSVLFTFKYVPFVLESIGSIANLPKANTIATLFQENIIPPLGLSFFTFECIAYLVDVYRGAPASQQFIEFAAYKFFFPKLISGPITRYHPLKIQLRSLQFPIPEKITEGLWLIACGAVKKSLIADNLAQFVNLSFDNLQRAGSIDLWLAIFAYGLQLYFDFSGYVDIARGSATLMGLNLPENFDYPYMSTSIADFWRKWHITLGEWLRNYLYFPLGGSRKGLLRTCLNLLIIMFISGIWHGAAWGFIIWGLIHGVALVIHRITEAISNKFVFIKYWWRSIPGTIFAWALTQTMVFMSWIWFRLPNLKDSTWAIENLWGNAGDPQFVQKVYLESFGLERSQLSLLLVSLMIANALSYTIHRQLKLDLNWPLKIMLVPLCFFAVWLLAPEGQPQFIYFDF